MNFDEELERLLLIEDHDEMIFEVELIEIEFDLYLKDLEAKQTVKPDWWYIGLGSKTTGSPVADAHAIATHKEFLKFRPGVDYDTFDDLVKLFIESKTRRA